MILEATYSMQIDYNSVVADLMLFGGRFSGI